MFKRKQDVDKHVLSVLNRKKDEKERNAQGYQIARLYLDIKEYETAKRYLAGFLRVRENSPQAHQMMGEINEALAKKELAVDNYKRALDLGGFGSSNRQLVLKICELYCDLGTDDQRMKYWLQKCEELFPQSDIVYRMKSQILSSSSNGSSSNAEMERLFLDEMVNRPKDLDPRIKLLHLYLDMGRVEEAYDTAVDTDLTTAFYDSLPWYECVMAVFEKYSQSNPDCASDMDYLLMNMHVLRNVTILSLPSKPINTSVQLMKKFDQAVKDGEVANIQEDSWQALVKEMKGQVMYLAGLFITKRAMMGSIPWKEANQLSGACFLACVAVSPLDAQAAWFVKPRKEFVKFNNWWYQQGNDRLSQAGHMIQQLSQNDAADWSRVVHAQVMTGLGQRRVFEAVYSAAGGAQEQADSFFLFGTELLVSKIQEPLTNRQLLDIDRVAYQVHLGKLSHLVWLCLQRYSPNMDHQPNYHFNLMENIQFSVKNMETAGSENLCQLDILTFLIASVRCAASSISDNVFSYDDHSGRPTLLPASLSRPFCTPEQEEWWDTAFKFCSNTVKDNFSRLRRVLIRGVEVIRLKGTHGVSISMQCHLARCLDAKVRSLKESEFGCRCSAAELAALEARALFYWERARDALSKFKKNQHPPVVKNRMFKEAGDGDLPPQMVDKLFSDAEFATALALMAKHKYQDALERFAKHKSSWASFYSAQILRRQAEECQEAGKMDAFKSLLRKARDSLYKTMDSLNGDKSHELNFLVSKEMDDLEIEIQGFDWDENESSSARDSFYTPTKTPSLSNTASIQRGHDASVHFSHSTPRRPNVTSQSEASVDVGVTPSVSQMSQLNGTSPQSPHSQQTRPSPERLDSQIKSLGYSQTTLFKTVLDRNEELVLMHSRIMGEHSTHNSQLQAALTENKKLMEDLKVMLVENRDMLKGIKAEIATLKSGVMAPPSPIPAPGTIPTGPQLIVAPPHLPQAPRGAYPGFPPPPQPTPGLPSYPGYLLNSPIPPGAAPGQVPPPHGGAPTAGPNYRLQTARSSGMGKFKLGGVVGMGGEEDEDEDDVDELEHTVEDFSAMYPEYFGGADQDYSQFYTPDSHLQEWSMRSSGMDPNTGGPLSMSPAIQQPPATSRMPMPQPGFFASALRGQSLQFQQQPSSSVAGVPMPGAPGGLPGVGGGNVIGPGFFSPPASGTAEGMTNVASPSVQGNIPIFSAMSSIGVGGSTGNLAVGSNAGQVTGLKEALSHGQVAPTPASAASTTQEDLGASLGFKILFHIKAILPSRQIKGGITILLGPNNSRTTVVMMSDTEEMVFQHDANGLVLLPATPGVSTITWTASKIGATPLNPDKETVTIITAPESMGNLLRDALQKAADSTGMSASAPTAPSSASPSLFGSSSAATSSSGSAKTVFGGLSFSGTPVLTPVSHTEREKATPHKGVTSPVKTDSAVKPFAGVSLSVPKFASPVSSAATSLPAGGQPSPTKEDERQEEYEPSVDFKPVIPLPELVEKKTGEENETVVFVERCRLFRYDSQSNQWKERGVGEMKILCDNKEHRYRVVMRRDQIFKLCANHFISGTMKLSPLANSDKTWCYNAIDYSDEEMKMEQLGVKFKNQEKAKRFQDAFEDCVKKTKKNEASSKPTTTKAASKPATDTNPVSPRAPAPSTNVPLSELFKPKAGNWECPSCMCQNQAEHLKCPACSEAKPDSGSGGATSQTTSTPFKTGIAPSGGFVFGSASASPSSVFGVTSSTTSKPPSSSASTSEPGKTATGREMPLSELFKPKAGVWECEGCLCHNQAEHLQCPACGQRKPEVNPEDLPKSTAASSTGGFRFGSGGGFTVGSTGQTTSSPGGFSFGAPKSAATSSESSVTTEAAAGHAPKSTGFSFQASALTDTSSTPDTSTPTGGFRVPTAGAFAFGSSKPFTPSSSSAATPTKPATVAPQGSQLTAAEKQSAGASLLASLLTADESNAKPEDNSLTGFSFSMTPGQKSAANEAASAKASTNNSFSSASGFNFNFQKSPVAIPAVNSTPTSSSKGAPSRVPTSPEVDEHGLYVTKDEEDSHIHFEPVIQLPDKIEAKTGEEEEKNLFESRARMYRFVSGEWKEKGTGVMKILEHKDTKKARVVMRRDQVLKICCNHTITPELDLQPMPKMEGKAWLWYALDYSDEESKMEQLAVRFKKPETAEEFKNVFNRCKDNASSTKTPEKKQPQGDSDDDVIFVKEEKSPAALFKAKPHAPSVAKTTTTDTKDEDDDVVFLKEDQATPEQKALAAKYMLPANFYLYEQRKPCKGCLGCTDGEGLPPNAKTRSTPKKESASQSRSYADAAKSPNQPPLTPSSSTPPSNTASVKSILGTNASSSTPPISTNIPDKPSGVIGKSIFGSSAGLDSSSSIFGGGSPSGTGTSPSIFGGGAGSGTKNAQQKDFSNLFKGGSTPTTTGTSATAASSPFSSFVFGAGSSTPDFSSLAASTNSEASFLKKTDSAGPFKFQGAGQKLFGTGGDCGGDDGVAPSTDIHFEPIIPLPELVDVKTGDEDWTNVFCHRAKLYKYDSESKQWKERGIGDIKIMKFNQELMFRILQRREQVLKVSCNHVITKDMSLKPMSTSLSSWCWVANDLADEEPSVAQFAVKFKTKEIAAKFKAAFEECQQKLKEKEEQVGRKNKRGKEVFEIVNMAGSGQDASLGNKGHGVVEDMTSTTTVTPLGGGGGNVYHSKALDVIGQDTMTKTTCVPLDYQGQEVVEDMTSTTTVTPLGGGGGNVYHSKALDVTGQDTMTKTTCVPLDYQGQEVVEDMTRTTTVTPLGGGRGNVYHSKALDVIGQDTMTKTTCVPLDYQGQEVVEDMTRTTTVTPLGGGGGNVYHSKALDVIGQDTMTKTTCVPLDYQGQEVVEDMTRTTTVTPLGGGGGNVYHSKALDVTGQDTMTKTTCVPLDYQGQEVVEDMTSTTTVTPLGGGGGNVYHSKALDVIGQDTMTKTTCVPLDYQGQEVVEDMTSTTTVTPLGGGGGNVYHSKALDVTGQDTMTKTTCVPLDYQGQEVVEDMTRTTTVTPLGGGRGNVYHSKALDVIGQDTMTKTTCVSLDYQGQEVVEDMTRTTTVTPLGGGGGNVYHSKALDVIGQDTMTKTTCVPLDYQGQEVVEDMTRTTTVTPLGGGGGNVYHSKALDVTGQDTMTKTTCVPLDYQGQEVVEDMTSTTTVTPLGGGGGNVYHSKALDVIGQDTMTKTTCVPLDYQGQEVVEDMTSTTTVTPLGGGGGNVYHSKALDVIGQDTITKTTCVPLDYQGQEVVEDMTSTTTVIPLGGGGGNVYHSKALDVTGQDTMTKTTCVPLGYQGQEVVEDMTSTTTVTPLGGGGGNVYHSKALDVTGQDTVTKTTCVPLDYQGQEVVEDMTRTTTVTPLGGGGGNVYHSKALDVIGQDTMTKTTCVPLDYQGQEVVEDMTRTTTVTPLGGGGGNVYHSKALDVIGQDTVTKTTCVPLDYQGQEVVEDMTSTTTVIPLGGGGNVYHSKALDVTGQDTVTKTTCVPLDYQGQEVVEDMTRTTTVIPLGGGGNVYHSKALDVIGQDTMTKTTCVPLDYQGQEVVEDMTSTTTVIPLGGGGGNVYHSKALDVIGQDTVTKTTCVPLDYQGQEVVEDMTRTTTVTPLGGGGGNVYHSKALDVIGQDTMTKTTFLPLGKLDGPNQSPDLRSSQCLNLTSLTKFPSSLSYSPTSAHKTTLEASSSLQGATVSSTTPEVPTPAQSQGVQKAKETQEEEEKQQDKQAEEETAEEDDDDDGYEDVEDDDDDDDEDEIIFDKRATLQTYSNGKWKNLGTGQLCVKYNDDLNGNSISFIKDDGTRLCSHMICREHELKIDPNTKKSCEWKPLDYATDEAIRQHFKAIFSSGHAAEEFAKVFVEGKRLAMDSDLSEKLPTDIEVPEVFSRGDVQK